MTKGYTPITPTTDDVKLSRQIISERHATMLKMAIANVRPDLEVGIADIDNIDGGALEYVTLEVIPYGTAYATVMIGVHMREGDSEQLDHTSSTIIEICQSLEQSKVAWLIRMGIDPENPENPVVRNVLNWQIDYDAHAIYKFLVANNIDVEEMINAPSLVPSVDERLAALDEQQTDNGTDDTKRGLTRSPFK